MLCSSSTIRNRRRGSSLMVFLLFFPPQPSADAHGTVFRRTECRACARSASGFRARRVTGDKNDSGRKFRAMTQQPVVYVRTASFLPAFGNPKSRPEILAAKCSCKPFAADGEDTTSYPRRSSAVRRNAATEGFVLYHQYSRSRRGACHGNVLRMSCSSRCLVSPNCASFATGSRTKNVQPLPSALFAATISP